MPKCPKYLNGLGKRLRFEDWDYEDEETRDKKTRRLGDKEIEGDTETRGQTEKSV